jgi:hypothetical protein
VQQGDTGHTTGIFERILRLDGNLKIKWVRGVARKVENLFGFTGSQEIAYNVCQLEGSAVREHVPSTEWEAPGRISAKRGSPESRSAEIA